MLEIHSIFIDFSSFVFLERKFFYLCIKYKIAKAKKIYDK